MPDPVLYVIFGAIVVVLLGIDLFVVQRNPHAVTIREAAIWSAIWIGVSIVFGLLIPQLHRTGGPDSVLNYFTGYVIEKSLSVDNVFLFVVIFTTFAVPRQLQHRVLFYGVLGAIVMRTALILAGAALVERFHWVLYIFGVFLLYVAWRTYRERNTTPEVGESRLLVRVRRVIPTTRDYRGEHFFVREGGRLLATPLFIILVIVEFTDLVFAVDSIPAIFAVTTDPFIVLTSNIFAIMGLRSLYFLLAGAADRLKYLSTGLAVILAYVGVKLLTADIEGFPHPSPLQSLAVIMVILGVTIVVSLRANRREEARHPAADPEVEAADISDVSEVTEITESPGRPMSSRRIGALLLLAAVALTLGWWTKARCLGDGRWEGGEEYLGWCYTDVVPLYHTHGLDFGLVPYLETGIEYPVLTGLEMWAGAALASSGPGFLAWTALGGGALLLAAVAILVREAVPWPRIALFAAAPTLIVYSAMNWDAAPVLALVGAIALHRQGRDGWAGAVVGLGAAAKLFPAVLVPLVVLARLRQGRPRAALAHAVACVVVLVMINLPFAVLAPEGWSRFFTLNATRPADWDSLWFLAEQLLGQPFTLDGLNVAAASVVLVGGAIVLAAGTRRRPPERWWELALPLLVWFLLANKVYSPQFSLWLLPLLVWLVRDRAQLAAFLVADLMVFAVRFPFLAGQAGFEPAPAYPVLGFAVAVRAVVLLWILVTVTLDLGEVSDRPRVDPAAAAP